MNNDNWIVLQDNEGFAKVISERLFNLYMKKIDDYRVMFKECTIDVNDVDEETRRNDPHKFGDWSHLNAKIIGCYKLVI